MLSALLGPAALHPAVAIATSAVSVPIDVDGTYTFAPSDVCPSETLTISGGTWWTPGGLEPGWYDGDFTATQTVNGGDPSSFGGVEGFDNQGDPTITLNGGTATYLVAETGTTVTLTQVGGGQCVGVATGAENLSSLPTISGTQTKADGTPFGGGVYLQGTGIAGYPSSTFCSICLSDQTLDGHYEFWVQPANTYTVEMPQPSQIDGKPAPWAMSQCTGHKTGTAACTFVVTPNNPPNTGKANFVLAGGTGIAGRVTDVDDSAMGGVEVDLTGNDSTTGESVSQQTVTANDGRYSFTLDPGSYSVTPAADPAGGVFLPINCSGTSSNGACAVTLKANQNATADFRRATLIVNSTQTGTNQTEADKGICDITPNGAMQTCTLPQAVLTANALGGQPVAFNIPTGPGNSFDGGVPQIKEPSGDSIAVYANTIIFGDSQPGAGRVELSGRSADNSVTGGPYTTGLTLDAAGITVEGMVINGYSDGIIAKEGDTIQGDWFGTNATASAADPDPLGTNTSSLQLAGQIGLDLTGGDNQIGGPARGQQNVFVAHWAPAGARPAAALLDESGGNIIQGNSFGVVAGSETALIDPRPGPKNQPESSLSVEGTDTIGGVLAGDRNVISPEARVGSSVVQGNTLLGDLAAQNGAQIGGATPTPGTGLGNVFSPAIPPASGFLTDRDLEMDGPGVVQGNEFKPTGEPAIVAFGGVTIGGATHDLGNLIDHAATDPSGPEGPQGLDGAITLRGKDNVVEHNTLNDNGGWGAAQVDEGDGDTITRNTMVGNPYGIEFANDGYVYDTDVTQHRSGPNDYEYYPILLTTTSSPGATDVHGRIEQAGTVTVDLYSEKRCGLQSETPGQGETYLGSTKVSSALGGEDFTFSGASTPSGQTAITATATSSNGSTSEFSPCMITDSHAPSLASSGVTPASTTVAVTTSTTAAVAATRGSVAAATHHRRAVGHGSLWLLCPPRTTGQCTGTVTIRTSGSHPVTIIHKHFTINAGSGKRITLTLKGKLLKRLEGKHRVRTRFTSKAHDGAKHSHHRTRHAIITLVRK